MNKFKNITVSEAKSKLQQTEAIVLDVRDNISFEQEHIDNAIHLTDANISSFLRDADKTQTTIVVCYHGNSSQGVAHYLVEEGFGDVYSVIGGFEEWKKCK